MARRQRDTRHGGVALEGGDVSGDAGALGRGLPRPRVDAPLVERLGGRLQRARASRRRVVHKKAVHVGLGRAAERRLVGKRSSRARRPR